MEPRESIIRFAIVVIASFILFAFAIAEGNSLAAAGSIFFITFGSLSFYHALKENS